MMNLKSVIDRSIKLINKNENDHLPGLSKVYNQWYIFNQFNIHQGGFILIFQHMLNNKAIIF